jgi:hypothetical protein
MVEAHKGADAGEVEGLRVVGVLDAWAVMAMDWDPSCRNMTEMASPVALVAQKLWLG